MSIDNATPEEWDQAAREWRAKMADEKAVQGSNPEQCWQEGYKAGHEDGYDHGYHDGWEAAMRDKRDREQAMAQRAVSGCLGGNCDD